MKEYDDGRENGRGPQVLPLKSLIYPRLMCNLLPLEGTLRGHPPPPLHMIARRALFPILTPGPLEIKT
jgi:hypothetical protein